MWSGVALLENWNNHKRFNGNKQSDKNKHARSFVRSRQVQLFGGGGSSIKWKWQWEWERYKSPFFDGIFSVFSCCFLCLFFFLTFYVVIWCSGVILLHLVLHSVFKMCSRIYTQWLTNKGITKSLDMYVQTLFYLWVTIKSIAHMKRLVTYVIHMPFWKMLDEWKLRRKKRKENVCLKLFDRKISFSLFAIVFFFLFLLLLLFWVLFAIWTWTILFRIRLISWVFFFCVEMWLYWCVKHIKLTFLFCGWYAT